jgi:predicted enzyme related to lactoylglutathione lyase
MTNPRTQTKDAPLPIGHIGICVSDVGEAVQWYESVFGWRLLAGPMRVSTDDAQVADQLTDVFDSEEVEFIQAHMLAGNGVAVELFRFQEPRPTRGPTDVDLTRPGYTHICLVAHNLQVAISRIIGSGGRQLSEIHAIFPGEPYRFAYCADPFGNVIEISSHAHDTAFEGRAHY